MNNFKIVFETHLNSRTNTETLAQLIEQTLYRHPQYCIEIRSYLGNLQQANILSLDMYAALIAEIEQFEEKHISITFEQWRTQPETLRFSQQASNRVYRHRWLVGSVLGLVVLSTTLWFLQSAPPLSPHSIAPASLSLPVSKPAPPPNRLIAQNLNPNSTVEPPLTSVSTGDVEPPLPHSPPAPKTTENVEKILKNCQAAFAAQRLTSGKGETALECYRKVLVIDANNQTAKAGLVAIEKQYGDWAMRAIQKKQLEKVQEYERVIAMINPNSPLITTLQQKRAELK